MNSTTKLISTFKNKHLLNKLIKKSYLCSQNKIGVNQNNICKKSPELVSLDQRLLNYISSLQRSSPSHNLIPNDAIDPRSLKNSEIPLYINNLQNQNKGTSFLLTLQEIDQECCRRLVQNDFTRSQILLVLNSFVATAPYYARSLKFYPQALKKVGFFIKILTIPEIVELCFYTGFLKKSDDSKRILGYALRKLNNKKILRALSLDDIVILVSAAFKTGTRIVQNDGINNEIKVRLCNELSILQDESYFIALVKSMRHNFNYDEEILSTLAYAMFFNKTIEKYNFTALAHIVTLYADALYFDSKLFENFTLFGLKHLRNFKDLNLKNHLPENFSQKDHFSKKARLKDHFSKNLRLKDLSRFLFSLSYIGFENLKNEDFALLSDLVKSFVNLGFLENGIEDFLSILLSFAMLEHFDEQLIGAVLKEKLLVKGRHKNTFKSRLNILLTSINIEQPLIFEKLHLNMDPSPNFNLKTQIDRRLDLVKIYNVLNSNLIKEKYKTGFIEYSYAIPHLNIAGIMIYDNDNKIIAFIECVDESNCTKYVEILPHGYMKLKLRLLKSLKKPLLVVDKETIEDMEDLELIKYLDKKLKIAFYLNSR